jgi:nucleoside-diphosphate-sugar epimerase
LGNRIAHYLLEEGGAQVRILNRASKDAKKTATVAKMLDRGVEVVEGDLSDAASLDRATQGVDVIISAVQGGPDVIVDGQVALAEAGKRNGASRILPSDYGLDLFKATPGEHMMFDIRRTADEKIAALGLEQVNVLQGAFMDMFRPGAGTIGNDGVVSYWGDGTALIDVTSVDDTAHMIARVSIDANVPAGKFAFSGDRISILDAAAVLEKQTGSALTRRSMGSEADLRAALVEAQGDKSNPFKAVMFAYQLYMLTGQTALTDHQNRRYADVELEGFASFAAREMTKAAA